MMERKHSGSARQELDVSSWAEKDEGSGNRGHDAGPPNIHWAKSAAGSQPGGQRKLRMKYDYPVSKVFFMFDAP